MKTAWIYPTKQDVLSVHDYLIGRFGGLSGLRDEALLESAVGQPRQTFAGEDLYPSAASKAARYAYGIIKNHPFADGNKRTGTACLGMFLRLNGHSFKPRHDDLYRTVCSMADGTTDFDSFAAWTGEQLEDNDA